MLIKWVAMFAGPDGTLMKSVDLTTFIPLPTLGSIGGHAVVAFDGANYLVFHEDDNGTGPAPTLDALLVSSAGTIVSGPAVVGVSYDSPNFQGDPQALAFDGTR